MSFGVGLTATFFVFAIAWIWCRYKAWKNTWDKLDWIKGPPQLPLVGHVLLFKDSATVLTVFQKFNKEYNGLFKLNLFFATNIVATDYKFLEFILSSNTAIKKSTAYKYLHKWLGTGLLTSSGAKWKKRRRILTPAFHFSILEQFIGVFDKASGTLVKKLESVANGENVDIYPYITLCALDIICESAMGVQVNSQDNENSEYVKSVLVMLTIMVERIFSVKQKYDFSYRFTENYYKEKKAVKILHDYTYSIIEKRRKEIGNKTLAEKQVDEDGVKKKMAFLDLLLQVRVDGEPLSDEDIREEVDTFMFEGHDTISSGISFTLYCIAGNAEVQSRIVSEQHEIFGSSDRDRPTTYEDLQQMKYLEMVVKEGLRLYPSVAIYSRETEQDILYEEGKLIPKGTSIAIFAIQANRNPEYFENPDTFDPSRFENPKSTKAAFANIPFSAGPRNCIGQKFAMLEMKCTLSKILRYYEVSPSIPKHIPLLEFKGVLKSGNGIKMTLRKRQWV